MVTHDYERGVISGLPKSVLDHVRRTGQLPDDAMSVNLRAVWEGLLWQKSHAAEPPGMTVAEILRVRDGWDDAFDPEAWERMTGGKVPFSPAFDGMAPGPGEGEGAGEAKRKPTLGPCDCGKSIEELYPTGAACGDGGQGKVSGRTAFSLAGAKKCEATFTCKGGDLCACMELPIRVGIGAGSRECDGHGGFASGAPIKCTYFELSTGEGRCDCKVTCADGATPNTRKDSVGWDVCAIDERAGEETFEVEKLPCSPEGSNEKYEMQTWTSRVVKKLDKCSPTRGYWDRNPPPDDEEKWWGLIKRGCVENNYHRPVQIWCCNQTGTYWLKPRHSTCADDVDVDNVRAPDGHWWKLEDGIRAVVTDRGYVEFYYRESGKRATEGGATYWRIPACGED